MSTGSTAPTPGAQYRERLRVPVLWWVLLLLFLASVWAALAVSTAPLVMGITSAVAVAVGAGLLVGYGAVRIEVGDSALRAGRAHLEWAWCGPATALDAQESRRLRGVEADARAFLLLRPYIATAVRVEVTDPDDPTPYWMLSTRHPQRLAESINQARVLAD